MKKMFVLSLKRCLQRMLSNFTVKPGLNSSVLEELRCVVKSLPEEKKLVTLLFDEISLAPGVEYNSATGQIIEFEDIGNKKRNTLVLMIKELNSRSHNTIT